MTLTTLATIRKRLRSITSEKDELHPLLAELFTRIDEVKRYEYTHGSTEMGADFILVRTDALLKRDEYIGVIGKVAKVHQDLTTVNRQIEECVRIRRYIEGGKKEITLSAVWIVATDTITQGARLKINDAHRGSKIHFIAGDDLAQMILEFVPDYLSRVPLSVSSYLRTIREEVRETDTSLDIFTLDGQAFYLPQEVDRLRIDPYSKTTTVTRHRRNVDLLTELDNPRPMLVEAGMGGGKSKLLRFLVQSLAQSASFAAQPFLPVSTTYRELIDDFGGSVTALVEARVSADICGDLPEDAKVVVFVDAVDEKSQTQEELFVSLKTVIDDAKRDSRCRVVLTSRPIANLEFDREFAHLLNRYEIRRLSIGQIVNYLTTICNQLNLTRRIVDDIRRSPLFNDIPKSPLAAVLLAKVLRDDPKDLPATLPELYSKYLELALGRWDINKGLQSQQEYDVLNAVLLDLAQYLLDNQLGSVAVSEFRQRVDGYLGERNLPVTTNTVVTNALERSDVLVSSRDGHTVRFKHRSFAEFLEARRRREAGTMVPSLQAFEMYWANVYYFACGQSKDAPQLIEGLADLTPIEEQHRWLKPMNMANYVMAAYATPYRVIETAVYDAILEASSLFCDIAEGRLPTRFARLSRMHLLCLVQLIVRDHYGFEFLRPALETAALRGLDSVDEEIRPYFLFLLAVAAVDAGSEGAFDTIVKQYSHVLPIDVSLALGHELQGGARNKVLKRFDRRLRRKLRGNTMLQSDVRLLYDRPLSHVIGDAEGGSGRER